MSPHAQEILVRVIVMGALFFVVWKNLKNPMLSVLSGAFLKAGKVGLAMKLRPAKNSASCAGGCDCPKSAS